MTTKITLIWWDADQKLQRRLVRWHTVPRKGDVVRVSDKEVHTVYTVSWNIRGDAEVTLS